MDTDAPASTDVDDGFTANLEAEFSLLLRRARAQARRYNVEAGAKIEAEAYGVLVQLEKNSQVRPTDIANFFGIGKPTISRQLRDLEERGLISRARNSDDNRSFDLSLTDDGRELLNKVRAIRQITFKNIFTDWTQREREVFLKLFTRLNASPHLVTEENPLPEID